MKKFLLLSLVLLSACSKDKVTVLPVTPADFLVKPMTSKCKEPEKANVWIEVEEHHHFKCTSGFSEGERSCYGWKIYAFVKCEIKGIGMKTLKSDSAIAFGNSSLDKEERE